MESFIHFQQFCNHSFNCGICMLLKHVTMPWSRCKLVSYFVFKNWTFSNKQDLNIALITGTESEVFLNKHAPSAFLLFEANNVQFQSRLNNNMWFVCLEMLWYSLVATYFAAFFQDSVRLFQDKSPGKSYFATKSLIAPRLWQ